MNKKKLLPAIAAAVLLLAAAFAAVVLFRDKLASLVISLQCPKKPCEPAFTDEERESFADI